MVGIIFDAFEADNSPLRLYGIIPVGTSIATFFDATDVTNYCYPMIKRPATHPLPSKDILIGVCLALLAAIGFSGKAILVKLAYLEHADAVTLLALRMAFSLPFFIAIGIWSARQHPVPLKKHDKLVLLGLGFVGYYLSSLLDFLGLQYISAGLERLILFLYPTMTVLLGALIYRQPIKKTVIAAMLLSYAGIALVFINSVSVQNQNVSLGASLVFMSTLSYSIYLVGAGHAISRIGSMRFTAYAMIIACGATLLQFFLIRPISTLDLPLKVYELALGMAIFSTILPVFLLSFAIRRIGSGSTSLIGSIGPISTIFMAYLFLNENISWLQITGSTLVLAGVIIVSMNTRNNKQ